MSVEHVTSFFRRFSDEHLRRLCWELHKIDFGGVPVQWMKSSPTRQALLEWIDRYYIYSAFNRRWMTRRPLPHRNFTLVELERKIDATVGN